MELDENDRIVNLDKLKAILWDEIQSRINSGQSSPEKIVDVMEEMGYVVDLVDKIGGVI